MSITQDVLRYYVRQLLVEDLGAPGTKKRGAGKEAPLDLGDAFQYQGWVSKHRMHRYELMNPEAVGASGDGSIENELVRYLGELEAVEGIPTYMPPGDEGNGSGKYPAFGVMLKSGENIKLQIVMPNKLNLVTGQHLGWLAEYALAQAMGGAVSSFDNVVAVDSRLKKVASRMSSDARDVEVENLRQVYNRMVKVSVDKFKQLKKDGKVRNYLDPGAVVGGGSTKVDVESRNMGIHVKYNDESRLVGVQKLKVGAPTPEDGKKPRGGKASKESLAGEALEQDLKEKEERELLQGNSTNMFWVLRKRFVEDLRTHPNMYAMLSAEYKQSIDSMVSKGQLWWKKFPTLGSLATMAGEKKNGMELVSSIKKMEAQLLYQDTDNRRKFIDYLTNSGYRDALERDIVSYLREFSEGYSSVEPGAPEKRIFFFNFYGKHNKSTKLVDVDSVGVSVKSFQYEDWTEDDEAGTDPSLKTSLSVEPNHEEVDKKGNVVPLNTVYLFTVNFNDVPVMKVEFRSIDGGGHPPQLHLLPTASDSGLFEVL